MKKILTVLLTAAMFFTGVTCVFAEEQEFTPATAQTQVNGSVDLVAEVVSTYTIKLPKEIDVTNEEVSVDILAKGDVDGAKKIVISESNAGQNKLADLANKNEAETLTKAGKIKKDKPLPEITDDEKPFDIPESWKWVYIGDLFQHNTGKALNGSDKSGNPYEYITTSNVYWNRFELDKLKTMLFTDESFSSSAKLSAESSVVGVSMLFSTTLSATSLTACVAMLSSVAVDNLSAFALRSLFQKRSLSFFIRSRNCSTEVSQYTS